MTHIFISYSHDDSDYAHKLEKALKKRGFEVWIDDRIGYGETWPQVLQEQVDACGAFIVILTPRSYGSDWVQNELARAKRKKKPVFPLLLEGDNWLAVEATQCADVRDGKLPPPVFYSRLERVFNSTGMAAPRREREPEVNYRCPPPRVPMPGEHSSTVSISNVTGGINSTIIAGRDVKDTSVATDGQASPVCEDDLDEYESRSPEETRASSVKVGGIDGGIHDAIIAGRDVIHNIINTGDHNRFFVGDYERLRDAYIEPQQVFDRVDLEHFTGREWLLNEIDSFLNGYDRGYFILEAEAGLGKTTVLAWLVRKRGYIHHFCELAPGVNGVGTGLRNLAAQLVLAYHLSEYEEEGVLPGAADRPDFIYALLKQASKQREDGEKVVLVVDALDEAGTPSNQNVLGLPQALPSGVFIIASQRPAQVTLQVDTATTPRYLLALDAESDNNQADMRRFLEQASTWPGIARALQNGPSATTQFVQVLLSKCRGVWIYLHYVIHEIERGERSPWDLETLPNGIAQYYARHWRRWYNASAERWERIYLPLLSTLAAAQEKVSGQQLCALAGIPARPLIRRLLQEEWRPFLTAESTDRGYLYRPYHASLREFMAGDIDAEQLTETEQSFANDLARAVQEAHSRISTRYLEDWGGLECGLPHLSRSEGSVLDRCYGLRHLFSHLEAAGRSEEWSNLLTVETSERRSIWHEVKESQGDSAGYLSDLSRAWDQAVRAGDIGRQVQYALIYSSIVSLAQRPSRKTRHELSSESALEEAALILDPLRRIERLAELLPSLDPAHQAQAISIAVSTAEDESQREYTRARSITDFASFFAPDELVRMCTVALSFDYKSCRAPALCALAAQIEPSAYRQAIVRVLSEEFKDVQTPIVRSFWSLGIWPMHPSARYELETYVTLSLPYIDQLLDSERRAVSESIVSALQESIESMTGIGERLCPAAVDLVVRLVPHLSRDWARMAQEQALQALLGCKEDENIANGLLILAPCLDPELFPRVSYIAESIQSEWIRAETLLHYEEHLSDETRLRLYQVLNSPWRLVTEVYHQYNSHLERDRVGCGCLLLNPLYQALARATELVQLSGFVLAALITWLVAQFEGGLHWDTKSRPAASRPDYAMIVVTVALCLNLLLIIVLPLVGLCCLLVWLMIRLLGDKQQSVLSWFARTRSSLFPKSLSNSPTGHPEEKSIYQPSAIGDDKQEHDRTLVALVSNFTDLKQQFLADFGLVERVRLRLGQVCESSLLNRSLDMGSWRILMSDVDLSFLQFGLLGLLGALGSMPMVITSHSGASEPRYTAIAGRLDALDIPGFTALHRPFSLPLSSETFDSLASILPTLPIEKLEQILPDLLDILQDLDSLHVDPSRDCAKVLAALSCTPIAHSGDTLKKLVTIASRLKPKFDRAIVLSSLLRCVQDLSSEEVAAVLDVYLRASARRGRQNLMVGLRLLSPLIKQLGGREAVGVAARAIADVGCWWP